MAICQHPFQTLIERLNGIIHEYSWLDKHPNVRSVIIDSHKIEGYIVHDSKL